MWFLGCIVALVISICAFLLSLFLVRKKIDCTAKLGLASLIGVLLFAWLLFLRESPFFVLYEIFDLGMGKTIVAGFSFFIFYCLPSTFLCTAVLYLLKYRNASRSVLFSHIVIFDVILGFLHLSVIFLV